MLYHTYIDVCVCVCRMQNHFDNDNNDNTTHISTTYCLGTSAQLIDRVMSVVLERVVPVRRNAAHAARNVDGGGGNCRRLKVEHCVLGQREFDEKLGERVCCRVAARRFGEATEEVERCGRCQRKVELIQHLHFERQDLVLGERFVADVDKIANL
jgi:hypothetical protein